MTRRWTAVVAVTASLLLVGACTGGDDGEDTDTGQRQISPADLPTVPELDDDAVGARQQLELADCPTDAGEQQVEGTFTNTEDDPVDVVVTVSWTNDGSDVLARAVDVLEGVGGGEEAAVALEVDVPEGVSQCVVNVRAGELQD